MSFSTLLGRKRLFWIVIGAVSLLTLTLRTLSLIFHLDAGIGYFVEGAALPVVVRVFEILALLLCFAPFFLLRGDQASELTAPNLAERICIGIAAGDVDGVDGGVAVLTGKAGFQNGILGLAAVGVVAAAAAGAQAQNGHKG